MNASLSLESLAHRTGGRILRGDPASCFTGVSALDTASAGEISFLGNEKYVSQFLSTKAGAVIVAAGHDYPAGEAALIEVENPTLAFSVAIAFFANTALKPKLGIHPSAFVDPEANLDSEKITIGPGAVVMAGASIGNGTEIAPNAVIHEEAIIGENCKISANVTITQRCVLGNNVIVHPGTVIGSDGYGYEFSEGKHVKIDQVGIVEIGNDVEIGSNTTIDRARFGKTQIGEGTKIDNLVQIGHNVVIGKHCLIISQTGLAGSCIIEDYVTIAAQAGVGGHVTIGSKSILAARAGATTDLEGGITYSGKPAIPMRDEAKQQAAVRRLSVLRDRVKKLEIQLKKEAD